MAVTSPFLPTPLDSMQEDSFGVSGFSATPNACIKKGRQLNFAGQTANTSASNVANQAVGTVKIPSGTADGGSITITNSLIGATSLIVLQVKGSSGKKLMLDNVVPASGSATFTVRTADAAATTADCDVWYWIVN